MKNPSFLPRPLTEYDLRLLKIFKAVVEAGGFTAAEAELGVTKSTISNHMSSLETRMKLTLCRRGRGGFSLTSEGQRVYQGILTLFSSLDDFSLLVNSLSSTLSGELIILTTDQFAGHRQQAIANVIAKINERAPQLHLVLDCESVAHVEQALLNDKAHLGIMPGYQRIIGLQYKDLTSEPIYLCCGATHPFFDLVDTDIDQTMLSSVAAIHPGIDVNSQGRKQLERLNLTAKAYQFDTRKTLIMSGRYLGFLPQSQIQQELNLGQLRLIKPDTYHYPFDLSLVTRQDARDAKKVELLLNVFAESFA